jgi:hypothetical protein
MTVALGPVTVGQLTFDRSRPDPVNLRRIGNAARHREASYLPDPDEPIRTEYPFAIPVDRDARFVYVRPGFAILGDGDG